LHSPVTNVNSVNSVNSVDNQLIVASVTTQEQPQENQCCTSVVSDSFLSLPGYTLYFNFDCGSVYNSLTRKRGVDIYITDTLSADRITFPSDFEEHLWISLKLCGSDVLTIGCIYRSPSSSIDTSTKLLCDLL